MNPRLIAMMRKEFIQAFRDRRTVVIILIMPMMQLFLLGYAATTDVKNIKIAVWDQSQTVQSRALLDSFRAADYFQIAYTAKSQQEIQSLIESGKVRAALIIQKFEAIPSSPVRITWGRCSYKIRRAS